jgi:hypothetical protein
MGYKVLGFAVWQGGKWYVRRRLSGTAPKVAVVGAAALTLGSAAAVTAVAAQRRSHTQEH